MPENTVPSRASRHEVGRDNEDNGQEQVYQTAEEEQRSSHLGLRQTENGNNTTQRGAYPAPHVQNQQQVPTANEDIPGVANIPQLNNKGADQSPELQHLAHAFQHDYECLHAADPLNDDMHARLQAVAETVRREDEQAWDDSWAVGVERDRRRSLARLMRLEEDARVAREVSDAFDYQRTKRESGQ